MINAKASMTRPLVRMHRPESARAVSGRFPFDFATLAGLLACECGPPKAQQSSVGECAFDATLSGEDRECGQNLF
jgi:hypothetical protein